VLTVTLERALELLAQPKLGRGGSKKTPLRELGAHPGDQEPVNIYKGPYGNYIKHGKINVGVPEGETVEEITLEKALELLDEKAATTKTSTTKKKTTTAKKKTTTKKKANTATTAKKTTATKKKTTKTKKADS
jgi:DNA topoisomerase-1